MGVLRIGALQYWPLIFGNPPVGNHPRWLGFARLETTEARHPKRGLSGESEGLETDCFNFMALQSDPKISRHKS